MGMSDGWKFLPYIPLLESEIWIDLGLFSPFQLVKKTKLIKGPLPPNKAALQVLCTYVESTARLGARDAYDMAQCLSKACFQIRSGQSRRRNAR